jgi:hypothetical protein
MSGGAPGWTDDRKREVAQLRRDLLHALGRLDALDLHESGAHLALAIHRLETGSLGMMYVDEGTAASH